MNSKSKMILRNIVALLALGSSQWANAQTDNSKNLGNEDIDIVKEYQPVLNDAFKISLTPQGDTSTSHAPSYTYNVEPQQMTPQILPHLISCLLQSYDTESKYTIDNMKLPFSSQVLGLVRLDIWCRLIRQLT